MTAIAIDMKPLASHRSYLRLKMRLLDAGFLPGSPSPEAYLDDLTTAKRMQCGACKAEGLLYLPFVRTGGGYRSLAICLRCSFTEEM